MKVLHSYYHLIELGIEILWFSYLGFWLCHANFWKWSRMRAVYCKLMIAILWFKDSLFQTHLLSTVNAVWLIYGYMRSSVIFIFRWLIGSCAFYTCRSIKVISRIKYKCYIYLSSFSSYSYFFSWEFVYIDLNVSYIFLPPCHSRKVRKY